MPAKELWKALIRSMAIQSSRNFWRMQNLGFAFSISPVLKKVAGNRNEAARMLERHLRLFSTNPYMTGPILGSVIRLEEDLSVEGNCPEADSLKKTLMAPYAAMGDSLFWGSLKPFAAAIGVLTALKGLLGAPLILLLIYNSVSLWVRLKGFFEGYKKGKDGIEFLKVLNLPQMSRRVRWMSTALLGILAFSVSSPGFIHLEYQVMDRFAVLGGVLVCYWILRQGVSSLMILYGAFVLFIIASAA